MGRLWFRAGVAGWGLVIVVGCNPGEVRQCRVHADCASGVCLPDGTCGEASPTPTAQPTPTSDPSTCVPDHDGQITRAEFPLVAGLQAVFTTATDVSVATAGTGSSPATTWTLTDDWAGGSDLDLELLDPGSQWFSSSFPQATYAARLSVAQDLLGVFQLTDDTLWLLGLVSTTGGATRTELVYDPPVAMVKLPLAEGVSWTADADVTGVFDGVPTIVTEQYVFTVDARGQIEFPSGAYPVTRVRAELTRWVGAIQTTQRSYAFLTECGGTIARIVSQENEASTEFTDAAEVWRLNP